MCGIVGYTGPKEAQPFLLEGLARLEYRGYDSAGVATLSGSQLTLRKRVGRIADLACLLGRQPAPGTLGIGHTRWATHGRPSEANAHPHLGGKADVSVAHNGVIENYADLKRWLESEGYVFRSQTDTEVIAHLVAHYLEDDLIDAVQKAMGRLRGTYGLAVISPRSPGLLVGARFGSPLVVGLANDGKFLASDAGAFNGHLQKVAHLEDGQICALTPERWEIFGAGRNPVLADFSDVEALVSDIDKGPFPHYMLKEIYEQPESLENAFRGRLNDLEASAHFGGLNLDIDRLRQVERIIMTACGTSYHAALVGEYLIEEFARIPVEVEYASEFRYRNPPLDRNTIVLAITQSGETADTLAALREAKRKGFPTLAICNVVGSSIAREADGGVFLHAGAEIGVASTKAFTAQVGVLTLLALYLGRLRHMSPNHGKRLIQELRRVPEWIRTTLRCEKHVQRIAETYAHAKNFLYLGRQYLFPVALEGALKLKEISYIHAEGYPAAEMKHGPIALVDEATPSVFLIPQCSVFDKIVSNLEEIKARGGPIIAIATEGDEMVAELADEVIYVPNVPDHLQPLVAVVPLQLLAYHVATYLGCDVDKPRNLAKSVTVE